MAVELISNLHLKAKALVAEAEDPASGKVSFSSVLIVSMGTFHVGYP